MPRTAMTDVDAFTPANATVSLTALAPFMRLLEEAGPDKVNSALDRGARAFERWGLSVDEIERDPTVRLPHGLVIELLLEFIEVFGDPAAPLRAGLKLQRGDYELLEYLCGSCSTLGESSACLSRYYPLLIAAEHELHIEGDRAESRFRIAPGLAAPDAIHEFGLASNFAMSILHLQLEGAQLPLEIRFAHAAPAHAAVFSEIFHAPVHFECEHNAIVFPVRMLEHPLRTADPVLHAVLTRLADQELAALSDQSAFPAKVREAIELELEQGAALEQVAKRLHMSPSALRSRLRRHGTTYSDLLDRLRRDYAQRALRQSQLSVAEVGHRLGFAHPPAFNRAFRRWFGVTPNAYRATPSAHVAARFWRRRS
jgi:AraC-like DNA-binding protein